MIRLTASIVVLIALVACGAREERVFAPPTGPAMPPVPAPPTPAQGIGVPAEIRGTYTQYNTLTYEVTAPSNGTLVARLAWDPRLTGARLGLGIGDTAFHNSFYLPSSSPVVGRVEVQAGRTYRVSVQEVFAVWDYGGASDPFVLTIFLE